MNQYDKLKEIIDELEILMVKSVTSTSPEFIAWKTKTERFLIGEYGKDSYEIDEFRKMRFSLGVYALGTPQSDLSMHVEKGLNVQKPS